MKIFLSLSLMAVTVGATSTRAAEPPPRRPLPAADCINTSQINDWSIVDARSAIVRTGPKHYLVTLQVDCPQLSHPPGLIFRSSRSPLAKGSICGSIGETVHSRGQPECAIESVTIIDKARFTQLGAQARRYKSADAKPATPAH